MKKFNHAIITGGSSGIGKALAKQLYQAGSNLTLIARDQQKLEATKIELEALIPYHHPTIYLLSADVRDEKALDAGIAEATIINGLPDLLITSAGIAEPGYFQDIPLEEFKESMSINYLGTVATVKIIIPLMQQQCHGHVVIISSAAGLLGVFGYTSYAPTKFALRGFAEALDQELYDSDIKISIAFPSDTDTPQLHRENIRKPKETFAISGKAKTWSADSMATEILKGVTRKKFYILPGFETKILGCCVSFLLPLIRRYLKHLIRKVRS